MRPAQKIYELYQQSGKPQRFFVHLSLCQKYGITYSDKDLFLMATPHKDKKDREGWFVYGAYSNIGIGPLVKLMPYFLPYLFWWRPNRKETLPYSTERILRYVS